MKKILLVDDVKLFLRLEETFFRRTGCEILTADCGTRALELARRHRPDLILLDYIMPDLMGDEVCRELKSDPKTSEIPVMIVSTSANQADIKKCLVAGARDYVTKPINAQEILAKAGEILKVPQRVHFRVAVTMRVAGEASGRTFVGSSRNLSLGGLLVECDEQVPPGTVVSMELPILENNEALPLAGKVVRVDRDHDSQNHLIATTFVSLSPSQENALADFMLRQRSQNAV